MKEKESSSDGWYFVLSIQDGLNVPLPENVTTITAHYNETGAFFSSMRGQQVKVGDPCDITVAKFSDISSLFGFIERCEQSDNVNCWIGKSWYDEYWQINICYQPIYG